MQIIWVLNGLLTKVQCWFNHQNLTVLGNKGFIYANIFLNHELKDNTYTFDEVFGPSHIKGMSDQPLFFNILCMIPYSQKIQSMPPQTGSRQCRPEMGRHSTTHPDNASDQISNQSNIYMLKNLWCPFHL